MNFIKTKLNKITKKELIKAEKEKKRCQRLYLDWKDDEYNCGPLKFIWGVISLMIYQLLHLIFIP